MQFRRQRRDDDNINLTPLIDVVFLLLIFFMVSTTFTKETHLEIDLPEAEGEAADSQPPLDVVVTSAGDYSVNGRTLVNNQLNTLKSALQKASEGDSDLPVTITADARAPHESVVRVMDAAGQMGFVNLSITTRRPDEGD